MTGKGVERIEKLAGGPLKGKIQIWLHANPRPAL